MRGDSNSLIARSAHQRISASVLATREASTYRQVSPEKQTEPRRLPPAVRLHWSAHPAGLSVQTLFFRGWDRQVLFGGLYPFIALIDQHHRNVLVDGVLASAVFADQPAFFEYSNIPPVSFTQAGQRKISNKFLDLPSVTSISFIFTHYNRITLL